MTAWETARETHDCAAPGPPGRCDVLVVGAGVAGLAAADAIARERPDLELTVLEADERSGGQIRTTVADDYTFEHGATALTTRRPATRRLVERLGIPSRTAERGRSHVYLGGRLHPVPRTPRELAATELLSRKGKLRLLAEPLLGRRAQAPDETVYHLVARRFGDEVARVAAMSALQGVTAGDARATSVRAVAPQLHALDRTAGRAGLIAHLRRSRPKGGPAAPCSFADGGLQALPEALSAALGSRLWTGAAVRSLRRTADNRYVAELDRGAVDAAQVVLAVPAGPAARLLGALAPDAAAELAAISTAPLRVLGLGYPRTAFRVLPDGVGFLAVPDQGLGVIGAILSSNLFPWQAPAGRVLVRAFLGGTFAPEAVLEPREAAIARVERTLRRLYGLRGDPEFVRDARWPEGIPQYPAGHMARVERIGRALAAHPGLHLARTAITGVGLEDSIDAAAALVDAVLTTSGAIR